MNYLSNLEFKFCFKFNSTDVDIDDDNDDDDDNNDDDNNDDDVSSVLI